MVAFERRICCLREDLFVEIAKLASKPDGLDHILIESSGISDSSPVAEAFTFKDAAGTSLGRSPSSTRSSPSSTARPSWTSSWPAAPSRTAAGRRSRKTRTITSCDQVGPRRPATTPSTRHAGRICQRHRREQVRFTGRRRPVPAPRLPQARQPQSQGRGVDLRPRRSQAVLRRVLVASMAWRGGRSRRDSRYHAQVARHELVFLSHKRSSIPIG